MSPISQSSHNNCDSSYGGAVAHQVNVLASCYIVDSGAQLKGVHYCTTGATGKLAA